MRKRARLAILSGREPGLTCLEVWVYRPDLEKRSAETDNRALLSLHR